MQEALKWQSHLIKFSRLKLGQQAVTKGFSGHAGLVGYKKYGSTSHNEIAILRGLNQATVFHFQA